VKGTDDGHSSVSMATPTGAVSLAMSYDPSTRAISQVRILLSGDPVPCTLVTRLPGVSGNLQPDGSYWQSAYIALPDATLTPGNPIPLLNLDNYGLAVAEDLIGMSM
jgi:hypothetical protein